MGKGGKKQPIVNSDSCIIIMFDKAKIISVIWSLSIPDSFSLIHPLCAMPIIVLKILLFQVEIPYESPVKVIWDRTWLLPFVRGSPLIQVQLPDVIFISRPINHSPYLLPTRFWIAFLINSHSCSVSITTRCCCDTYRDHCLWPRWTSWPVSKAITWTKPLSIYQETKGQNKLQICCFKLYQ